ncbi:hypothetical protein [uncultured Aquimarina sp.]|uniref:hypothetical protein n=1 Tax=uncultured Aquimarina sp. TaxID=575652 RepID=UPI0026142D06|nr:hypothetical protein [uncultured Aquimarina sp.]
MEFTFLNIKGVSRTYLKEKLTGNLVQRIEENELNTMIDNAMKHTNGQLPQIATDADFFAIDRKQKMLVDVSKRCAIQELIEQAPLIEGEEIEEDFFSYLTVPFLNFPKYTAVLKRKTNKAEIVYFFDLVLIDGGDIQHLTPVQPVETEMHMAKSISYTITGELVKKMLGLAAKKAGAAIASQLGAIIINMVMKELFGDDKEKMLAEIRKIVRDEIESNEITKIEGTIEGTVQFLAVEYKNMKAKANLSDTAKRAELLANLKTYSHKFYTDVIGTLKQEKYAIRGLKTFAVGSAIHLLITQEMAMIDPDEMNPNDSGYLLTLRANAKTYRLHLETYFSKAINNRKAQIEVFSDTFVDCLGGATCVTKYTYSWIDKKTGKKVKGFSGSKNPDRSASQNAHISMEKYRKKIITQLTKDLGNPKVSAIPSLKVIENFSFA